MIKLKLKKKIDDSYEIFIGSKLTGQIKDFLKEKYRDHQICLVSDRKISKLHGEKLAKTLQSELISFPAGEKHKTLQTIETLAEKMLAKKLNRKTILIALGGGVCGDITGFLASIYMRGVPFIQIPTSLLAMVDSSIGGKTAVDLKSGKNLIGTFYQPKAVFIDIDFLKTLSKEEFSNGMAEIIKHGIIKDKSYFNWIEKNRENIKKLKEKTLIELIEKSCKIKKSVVEKDEKEKGLRMILNYGHTIGHALEQLSDYKLKHGEAISIGMVKENNLSNLSKKDQEKIKDLLKYFNLPVKHALCKKHQELIDLMKNDKKCYGKMPKFAVPKSIGKCSTKEFTLKQVKKALND